MKISNTILAVFQLTNHMSAKAAHGQSRLYFTYVPYANPDSAMYITDTDKLGSTGHIWPSKELFVAQCR